MKALSIITIFLFTTLSVVAYNQYCSSVFRAQSKLTYADEHLYPRSRNSLTLLARGSKIGDANFKDTVSDRETDIQLIGDFTPMERVVLTSTGNLQRIMSAYYGGQVVVEVLKCDKVTDSSFDREVNLYVEGKKFCNAKGKIVVHDPYCLKAIESKTVGIGQLFQYIGVWPTFTLLSAKYIDSSTDTVESSTNLTSINMSMNAESGKGRLIQSSTIKKVEEESTDHMTRQLQRHYILECSQVKCEFIETFEPNFLSIHL